MTALAAHRFHFAFSIVYRYLFPQLTMGLGLLIVVLKIMHLRGNALAGDGARFWARIFGLTFVMGVVTGIPLEFQLDLGVAILVMCGSWLSGFFIIVTNASMQHPVGHVVAEDGTVRLASLGLPEGRSDRWCWWGSGRSSSR